MLLDLRTTAATEEILLRTFRSADSEVLAHAVSLDKQLDLL